MQIVINKGFHCGYFKNNEAHGQLNGFSNAGSKMMINYENGVLNGNTIFNLLNGDINIS